MDREYFGQYWCDTCHQRTHWYHYNGSAPACCVCYEKEDAERERHRFTPAQIERLMRYREAVLRGFFNESCGNDAVSRVI